MLACAQKQLNLLHSIALLQVAKGRAANSSELSRQTAAAWALHGGLRCLEPSGRLASELLPYARAIAARTHDPALQRLQPANWTRFWNGQLFEQQPGGVRPGGGGGWQQGAVAEEEEEAPAGEHQPVEDVIEESEDEDDW